MVVALQDGQHLAGLFEDLANLSAVLDAKGWDHVETLMDEDEGFVGRLVKVGGKPLQFGLWDLGISPLKVLPTIGLAIARETSVENHQMITSSIKRVEGPLLPDDLQELGLGEVLHAMVAQDAMVLEVRELFGNLLEIPFLHIQGRSRVDGIAQLDNQIRFLLVKSLRCLGQLRKGLSIVASSSGLLVGVVQVGHQPEP